MKETGVERFFAKAAYAVALMVWLIENKSDHEADAEIGKILETKPFMMNVIIGVLECYK